MLYVIDYMYVLYADSLESVYSSVVEVMNDWAANHDMVLDHSLLSNDAYKKSEDNLLVLLFKHMYHVYAFCHTHVLVHNIGQNPSQLKEWMIQMNIASI